MRRPPHSRKKRWPRVLLALAVAVAAAWIIAPAFGTPRPEHAYWSLLPEGRLHVLAHAGGARLWPDNTLEAFRGSHELGVDVLELDIQLTADQELVVIHDATVDRTTDGTGRVDSFTLAALQELDAAANWAGPDGDYPYRGSGVYVPSLREVLEEFSDTPVNIELKSRDPRQAELTCGLIRELGRELSVLVASFHQEQLRYFRELCPAVATSAGPDEVRDFVVLNLLGLGRATRPQAETFQVPVSQGGIPIVNRILARGLKQQNVRLEVWTINDADEMRRLQALGVTGLITDRPDLALALRGD